MVVENQWLPVTERHFSLMLPVVGQFAYYRRVFAAAANVVSNMMRENRRDHLSPVNNNKNSSNKGSKSSWMPDPVTGYYVPEDHFGETDVAQLREELLNQKTGGQM
ncbi:hypothetical protein AMTR_s00045p00188150 [Amborella trichopoda]|uniref:Uncharacterized protein n=1 Tax=Amborella trichopoda TaxID=13333 RepID=W1NX26_AMBTC|nr:hypothetical protein AMTR_s00045p00188150 [Amborella trichopoda]